MLVRETVMQTDLRGLTAFYDIRVEQGEMRFDSLLKEGNCVSFDASLLLRRSG